MKRRISIVLVFAIILINMSVYADIGIEDNLRSYILADVDTGKILEEYNIDEVVEIASISKLMSYVVVMDSVRNGEISLEDVVVIDKDTARINGSSFKLKEGEMFTVKELLEAAIVISGNDATYASAKYLGGTEKNFANMMNKKAKEIGLENAFFYNSTGLPIYPQDVQNTMTTRELFQLSKYILKNYPEIIDISKVKAISMVDRDFFQWNTNPLIPKIDEVDGLKTGFTNRAGYCHVSTFKEEAKKGEREELRLISIVMGAEDIDMRNVMSEILVRYGLDNYSKRVFLDTDVPADILNLPKGEIQDVNVFPMTGFSKLVNKSEDIEVNIKLKEDIKLPLEKDEIVGSAEVIQDGKVIYETDVISKEKVRKASWYVILGRKIKELFN